MVFIINCCRYLHMIKSFEVFSYLLLFVFHHFSSLYWIEYTLFCRLPLLRFCSTYISVISDCSCLYIQLIFVL